MAHYLTVTTGDDEGKTYRIDREECLIGRSPSAQLVLRDETVAWEHALVRESSGRLTLQNLSALGTRVKGRRVTEEARLSPNDEIQLSDRCRIILEQRLGRAAGDRSSRLTVLLLTVAVLVIIVGGGLALLLATTESARPAPSGRHWRQAYQRIDDRLETWARQGEFPREAITLYRDGWRLEQAMNYVAARDHWQSLQRMLLRTRLPGPESDGRTIAQCAAFRPEALGVIMGWDHQASSAEFRWKSDEAYADALVWFVKKRLQINEQRAEGQS